MFYSLFYANLLVDDDMFVLAKDAKTLDHSIIQLHPVDLKLIQIL